MPDDYSFDETGHVREQTVREGPTVAGEEVGENENKEAAKEAVRKAIKEASAKEKGKKSPKVEDEADGADDDEPVKDKPAKSVEKPASKKHKSPPEPKVDEEDSSEEESEEDSNEDTDHKKSPEEDEDEDKDSEALRKVLKNRAKIAKEKARAAEENQRIQLEFARQKAALDEQARQIEEGRKQLQKLKENPVEAVRQAGWDPEAFILDLAQSGTPEGQAQAKLRAMEQQIAQQQAQWQEYQRQQQDAIARAQYEQAVNYRQSMETQFLGLALDTKKNPYTAEFYKGRESALLAEGDIIAKQYYELTGKIAYPQEITEYIEEVLAERAEAWYKQTVKSRSSQKDEEDSDDTDDVEAETQASGGKGNRPKVSKTIESSPKDRRAVQKNLTDLDEDELREQARAEVRLAISKVKKKKSD